MTNIIDKYYNKVQDILLKGNSSDFDNDEYSHIVNNLEERYYNDTVGKKIPTESEEEEQDAVWGLFKKYQRLHGEMSNEIYTNIMNDNELIKSVKAVF